MDHQCPRVPTRTLTSLPHSHTTQVRAPLLEDEVDVFQSASLFSRVYGLLENTTFTLTNRKFIHNLIEVV